jgi:hypothetical protein
MKVNIVLSLVASITCSKKSSNTNQFIDSDIMRRAAWRNGSNPEISREKRADV